MRERISNPVDIKQLTNYEIAWALLSTILRSHDPAGVSLGRCRRNVLLKNIVHLIKAPPFEMDSIEGTGIELFEEAADRVKHYQSERFPQQMLLPFSLEPKYLDGEILAAILLVRLREWYTEDENQNRMGFLCETSLLDPAMAIIGLNQQIYFDPLLWQLDTDVILRESRDRDFRKYDDENCPEYWQRRSTI